MFWFVLVLCEGGGGLSWSCLSLGRWFALRARGLWAFGCWVFTSLTYFSSIPGELKVNLCCYIGLIVAQKGQGYLG